MNIFEDINSKKYYLNIQILRMMLSLFIVIFHFSVINNYSSQIIKLIIEPVSFYLATFFIISFYFSYNVIESRNIYKIKQRFKRILISYIIWPIIFFIINNLGYHVFGKKNKIQIKQFIFQLLIGNGFYCYFWFQFNLVIILLLFIIIIFIFKNKYLIVFKLLAVFCFFLLNSFYYNKLYSQYSDIISFSIGKLPNTYIYSLTGFYLSSINFLHIIKKHKKKAFFISFSILYLLKNNKLIIKTIPWLRCLILDIGAVNLFIIFSILPFDNIKNNKFIYTVKKITSHTGGIFYLHPKVIKFVSSILRKTKYLNLFTCLIDYLLTYFICACGSKLFIKSNLKYLFN